MSEYKEIKGVLEEIKQHLFELSVALDYYSAGKDYVSLRKTHYDNIEWINNHDLGEDYYRVLLNRIERDRE